MTDRKPLVREVADDTARMLKSAPTTIERQRIDAVFERARRRKKRK